MPGHGSPRPARDGRGFRDRDDRADHRRERSMTTASSIDGRRFTLDDDHGPAGAFALGQFVTLTDGAGVDRLGQIRSLLPARAGAVLGVIGADHGFTRSAATPFAEAAVALADAEAVAELSAGSGATL